MLALLADNDVQGQFAAIARVWNSKEWRELWLALNIRVESFDSLSLAQDAPDSMIWELCQKRQIVLVTGNRNSDGRDALEPTIRRLNDASCLPVFTIANTQRIIHDREYTAKVAELLLDYFMRIDEFRGAGRVFVP